MLITDLSLSIFCILLASTRAALHDSQFKIINYLCFYAGLRAAPSDHPLKQANPWQTEGLNSRWVETEQSEA